MRSTIANTTSASNRRTAHCCRPALVVDASAVHTIRPRRWHLRWALFSSRAPPRKTASPHLNPQDVRQDVTMHLDSR
jgi:hypothetical protein